MTLKESIANLRKADLSETDVVQALGITHLAYRCHAVDVDAHLPQGARRELYYSSMRVDSTIAELIPLYHTTYSQMHQALYNKPSNTIPYSIPVALAHLHKYDDIERLAKDFGITKKALPHVLKELGWHVTDMLVPLRSPLAIKIIDMLTSNPELTYGEIAKEVKCNRSYITHVAQSHGMRRQEQQQQDWPKVLAYARSNTVTSAAAHFDISRASIYYHIKKEKPDEV